MRRTPLNRVAIGDSLAVLFCPSPNGKVFGVTIDREDVDRVLAAGLWRVKRFKSSGSLYCYRSKNRGIQFLHRFLLNPGASLFVDHAKHRTLDNRKSEIRIADKFQNAHNAKRPRTNSTGFKGVTFSKKRKLYIAQMHIGNKHLTFGAFNTPEEAAKRYDEAAREHFGEFAWTNGDSQ